MQMLIPKLKGKLIPQHHLASLWQTLKIAITIATLSGLAHDAMSMDRLLFIETKAVSESTFDGLNVSVPTSLSICEGNAVNISAANVVVNGGTPPYTYQWYMSGIPVAGANSAALNISAPPLGIHTYTLQVGDNFGNTGSDQVVITTTCQPHIAINNPDPVCLNTPVSITTVVVSSSNQLTYQWFANGNAIAGANTQTLSLPNPPAGNTVYSVVVTEAAGCSDSDNTILTVYPNLGVNIEAPSACVGEPIVLSPSISNGMPPYTYQWYQNGNPLNNATSSTYNIANATIGTHSYSVAVTDINGCPGSGSVTFTVGNPPTVNVPNPNSVCSGSAVTLAASASGGSAPLQYQWYIGNTMIPNATNAIYNIASPSVGAVTYSVVVTDNNGCQNTDNATVTVYPNPSVNLPDPATACAGGSATLQAIVSEGSSPYTYVWQQNGNNISGSSSTLNVLTPAVGSNIYTVNISDAHGCTASDNATIAATVGISVSIQPVAVCEDAATMTINSSNISIVGGSAPYTYQWFYAGSPIAGANSINLTQATLAAGVYNYVLQVTDATGCTGADEATIAVNPVPNITLSQPQASCEGSPLLITSTIICSSQPAYQWFIDGTPIAGQISPNLDLSNPTVGTHTYTLQVISENTCIGEASVSITIYPAPHVNLSSSGGACAGSTATVSTTVTSGTAPYTYQWYLNGAVISGATSATYTINSAIAGNNAYSVLVTDAHGCTDNAVVIVETGNPPTVSINNPAEVCFGANIALSGSASGGVAPYTYQWYAGNNMIPNANDANYTAISPAIGTVNYTLVVTDSNGCSDDNTVVITVNPNPNIDAPDVSGCNAANVLLTSNTTGGSSPYNYQWYQNGSPVSGGNSANVNVSAPASGTATYMVSVSDANGCSDTDNAVVSTTNIALSVPDPMPICVGTSVTIGNATISGGALPYSFQWTNNGNPVVGGTSINLTLPNPAIGTQTYILNVTDANGCTGSDAATITVNPTPSVSINAPAPQCDDNGAVSLTANVSGVASSTYQWYSGGSPISGATSATLNLPNPAVGTTTYTVVATANGACTASANASVTIYPQPAINISTSGGTCSGDPATLTADITNGTPGYSFQWYANASPIAGAVSATLTINSVSNGTTYSVSVTDANGCTGSDIITLSTGTPPVVNVPNPAIACAGQSVLLQGSVSGGSLPYSYQWYLGGSPIAGATSVNYNVANPIMGATNYILVVTDNNGCTNQDDATITAYPAVNVNLSAPTGACMGSAVTLSSNVTSGTAPFSYQWSENGNPIAGANTAVYTVTNISAGSHTYTLVVTDANGCSETKNATVNVGTTPTIIAANPAPLCASSSVNLSSTITGGTAPFSYQWYLGGVPIANGASQNITVNNPPTGNTTYTVVVTDNYGCSASDNATVTVSSTMYVNLTQPPTLCQGVSATLTVNVSGGAMPYSYQWWQGANPISGANSASYNVNTPPVGNTPYSVQVMDANGCVGEASITVNVVSQPSVSIPPIAPTCGSSPMTITANISNGNGLSVQWYANGNAIAGANSATLNIANPTIGATTYSISVGEGSACAASDNVLVTVYDTPSVSITPVPSTCEGQNITISANATGGTPTYNYAWQHNGMAAGNSATINPSGLSSGAHTYSVTVTDSHGCTASNSTNFTINSQPVISIAPVSPVCAGSSMTLTATTNGAWTIQWFANGLPITGANGNTLNVPTTISGTYTYSVTASGSGSNCSDSAETTVTIYGSPSVNITPVPSTCEGQNITISANATGGTPTYNYAWQHNGMAAGNSATINPSGLSSGAHTYSVTVTDSHGCTASNSTNFTINPQPVISIAPVSPVCAGSSMTLTATTNGAWTIQWFANGSPITGANGNTLNVPTTTSGTYTYSVTASGSGSNCSDSAETTVTIYSNPSVAIAPVAPVCMGESVSMSASASGGSGIYTYQWQQNGAAIAGANSTTYTANGLSVGNHTYTLLVTDSNGCTASATITAIVTPQPTVSINDPAPVCGGTSVTLTATASGAGVSYQWYMNGTSIGGANNSSYTVASPSVGNTTYSVVVTTDAGCTASDMATVTIYPVPSVTVNNAAAVCAGSASSLSGIASGGTAPYTYQWYVGGSAIAGATSSSLNVSAPTVGNTVYTLVVTDANGCTTQDDGMITVNPSLSINIPSVAPLCEGAMAMATATVSGGTAPFSYQWYQGATALSGQTSATLNINAPIGTTVYSLQVTDAAACSATQTLTVTVYEQPEVTISGTNLICGGACTEATLTANVTPITPNPSGNYVYIWSNGATTPSISITPGTTSTYSVTVSIAGLSACVASDSHTITVSSLSVNLNDQSICEGSSATLTPTVSGANGVLSYVWSNGAAGPSITVSPVMTTPYAVSVSDASGCMGFDSGMVTVGRVVQANAGADMLTCAGASNATLGATAISGASYSWSNGDNTAQISVSPIITTTYTLTVNNVCGTTTDQVTVVVGSVIADAGGDQMTCAGNSVTLLASGGTSYAWSNGGNTAQISVSPNTTTTYTVTVSDANGCSDTDAVTVSVNALSAAGAVNIEAVCSGDCIELSAVTSATGVVSYVWSTGDTEPQISVSGSNATYSLTITDAFGCTASVSISNPCTPPSPIDAVNDQASTMEGVSVLINVLGNDEGVGIFITALTNPSNGTVIIQGNQIQYTPNAGFVGTDVFTYQICNAAGVCDIATVTVVVTDGNPPPPCQNISHHCVNPITPLQICPTFCALNGSYTITDADATYLCSISIQNNGTCVRYISLPLFTGTDTVHVYAQDQFGNTDMATLIIQIGDCDTWTGGGVIDGGIIEGGVVGGISSEASPAGAEKTSLSGLGGKTFPTDNGADNNISIVSLTPVPATDVLNIRFTGNEGKSNLMVYSITGVLLHQADLVSGNGSNLYRFDVKQLPAGAYLLKINDKSGTTTAKFVKQ